MAGDHRTSPPHFIRARGLMGALRVLWGLLRRHPQPSSGRCALQATHRVTITTRQEVPVRADGEIIGYSAVDIRLRPQAVEVIVPA